MLKYAPETIERTPSVTVLHSTCGLCNLDEFCVPFLGTTPRDCQIYRL